DRWHSTPRIHRSKRRLAGENVSSWWCGLRLRGKRRGGAGGRREVKEIRPHGGDQGGRAFVVSDLVLAAERGVQDADLGALVAERLDVRQPRKAKHRAAKIGVTREGAQGQVA